METVLTGFARALRAAGSEASSAEVLDAARAVALLGYADRANLKLALGLALAKTEEEKQIHDDVFELYFDSTAATAASSPPSQSPESKQAEAGDPASAADAAAASAPQPAATRQPSSAGPQIDALLNLADGGMPGASPQASNALQVAMQRAAVATGVDEIRFVTQTPYLAQKMMETLGVPALEARLRSLVNETSEQARAESEDLRQARAILQREARALIARSFELYGRPATEDFMADVASHRSLGRMAPADMDRMKAIVSRMARRLAKRHSRRQRLKLNGQLDMRRTIRANAGTDGPMFNLHWKQRRRDKPRIVTICDVSGSVASHVRFLLLFLYALHDAVGELRSFAFSHRLQEVSAPMEMLAFDDAMDYILKEVGSGSTDYGNAWADLQANHPDSIDHRTTVIVLGDGRSNGTDPRLDIFAEIADRAKRVLWLCPEPPNRWGIGDSAIPLFRPFCTSLNYSSTAIDLERTLDEALSAYH